jgi:hypothetical protein
MNPKHRPVIFLAITFVVMAPLIAFIMYGALHFPKGQWPIWATNTMGAWFAACFLILMLVARRSFRKQPTDSQVQTKDAEKARSVLRGLQIRFTSLVIFWSGLFLYGAMKTIQGRFPLERAIPAGAFLLIFIGLFGWALYQSRRSKA